MDHGFTVVRSAVLQRRLHARAFRRQSESVRRTTKGAYKSKECVGIISGGIRAKHELRRTGRRRLANIIAAWRISADLPLPAQGSAGRWLFEAPSQVTACLLTGTRTTPKSTSRPVITPPKTTPRCCFATHRVRPFEGRATLRYPTRPRFCSARQYPASPAR